MQPYTNIHIKGGLGSLQTASAGVGGLLYSFLYAFGLFAGNQLKDSTGQWDGIWANIIFATPFFFAAILYAIAVILMYSCQQSPYQSLTCVVDRDKSTDCLKRGIDGNSTSITNSNYCSANTTIHV